jgi:hypothetical protein
MPETNNMQIKLQKYRGLIAPLSYWALSECQKNDICNGCGPQGNFFNRLLSWGIPDNLFGLNIAEACNIHDFCWHIGLGKKLSDNLFMDNMSILINNVGGPLEGLRHILAFHYWLAVKKAKKN